MLNATLPVASALGALWLANLHARKMAAVDREAATEAAKEQRRFEARERRHDARREAVIMLMDADQEFTLFIGNLAERQTPEWNRKRDELEIRNIYALSRVSVLCSEPVIRAATELLDASDHFPSDDKAKLSRFRKALVSYRTACRVMLGEDDGPIVPSVATSEA